MRAIKLFRWVAGAAMIAAGTAAAQEWRDALPGDPLYEAKQRIETAELNAATDPLERAAVHLRHADRRVAEMQQLAGQGNTGAVNSLSKNYATSMQQAEKEIARARNQGRDTGRALQQVERATQKHTQVLTGLLDRVPEQAVPAIRHASEVSLRGRQTALEQLRGVESGRPEQSAIGSEEGRSPGTVGRPDGLPSVESNRPERDRGGFDRDRGPGIDRGAPAGGFGGSRPGGMGGGGMPGGSPAGGPPGR